MGKSDQGEIFELVLHGPSDNSPETREKLKEALSKKLKFPLRDVEELLLTSPLSVMKAKSEADLQVACETLEHAGGRVFIVKPKSGEPPAEESSDQGNLVEFRLDVDVFKDEPPPEQKTAVELDKNKNDGFEIDFSLGPIPEASIQKVAPQEPVQELPNQEIISEPADIKVTSNRTIYFELESERGPSKDKTKRLNIRGLSFGVLAPAAAGLAALIVGSLVFLSSSEKARDASEVRPTTLTGSHLTAQEKKAAPGQDPGLEADKIKLAQGSAQAGEISISSQITLNESGIKSGLVTATGPKPPPRTNLEIVKNIPAEPWLYKLEADIGPALFDEAGIAEESAAARAYIDREGKRERLIVPGKIRVQKLAEGKYKISFEAAHNFAGERPEGLSVISLNSGQDAAIFVYGQITAVAP